MSDADQQETTALEDAIRKAGSETKLAAALGVSRQTVNDWKRVPMQHVEKVHELYGITKKKLLAPHLGGGTSAGSTP